MRAIIVIFSANPLEDNVASKDNGSVSDGYLVLTVLVLPAEFQAGLGCLEEILNRPAIFPFGRGKQIKQHRDKAEAIGPA